MPQERRIDGEADVLHAVQHAGKRHFHVAHEVAHAHAFNIRLLPPAQREHSARIRGQIAAQRVQTVTLALRVKQVRAKLHVPRIALRHGELRAVQAVPQRFAVVDDGGVRGEVGREGAEQVLRVSAGSEQIAAECRLTAGQILRRARQHRVIQRDGNWTGAVWQGGEPRG